MPIDFNAITDARIDKSKVQLSSNTWSDKWFDMMKDTKVSYLWGTDKISMSIPVDTFINDKTQIINNLNPPYRHVLCLDAVEIIWYWFIFRMEQYEICFITVYR